MRKDIKWGEREGGEELIIILDRDCLLRGKYKNLFIYLFFTFGWILEEVIERLFLMIR
uniref:Uncharacterized protein n=1 Tax=Meloidogyne enterolobii TaxID=390850 RepID=A0A6V7U0Y1_MELEN|nr:unnamed protein product [Meloidogyne enterolobii]